MEESTNPERIPQILEQLVAGHRCFAWNQSGIHRAVPSVKFLPATQLISLNGAMNSFVKPVDFDLQHAVDDVEYGSVA